jgi:hypothetical protein
MGGRGKSWPGCAKLCQQAKRFSRYVRIAHNGRVGQETRTAWKSLPPPLNFFPKFTRCRNNRRQETFFCRAICMVCCTLPAKCELSGASQANTPALHFVIASGAVTNTRRRASFTFHGPNKIRNTATSFSRLAIIWDSFVSAGDSMSIFLNSISALPGLY